MADIAPSHPERMLVGRDGSIITTFGICMLALFTALLVWLPFDNSIDPASVVMYFGP